MNNHHYDAATRCVANKGAAMQATETTKEAMVSKLVAAWEDKNAKRAAQGAGLSLMALSLAACGGSDAPVVDPTPVDPTPVGPTALEVALGSAATVDMGDLGEVTDLLVTIAGSTPGADTQAVTLAAIGSGTITFDFADADDTVVLAAASNISGFTALEVVAGTLDVTAVDISDITSIDIASGIVMSATQFIAFSTVGAITSAATGSVEVVITTAAEANAVISAASTVTGGAFDFVLSPDSVLTPQDLDGLNALLDQAIIDNTANDVLPTAFANLATAVTAQGIADTAVKDFLATASTNATVVKYLDADSSGVVEAIEVAEGSTSVADTHNAAAELLDGLGDGATGNITGADFNALSAAQQTAIIDTQTASLNLAVINAQAALTTLEASYNAENAGANVAMRDAYDAYVLKNDAFVAAGDAVTADGQAVTAAAAGATAVLTSATETAVYDTISVDVTLGQILLSDTTADATAQAIKLTVTDQTTGLLTVNLAAASLANGVYTIEGESDGDGGFVTYTISASYLDALVAAQNTLDGAESELALATSARGDAITAMETAFQLGTSTEIVHLTDDNENGIADVVDSMIKTQLAAEGAVTTAETDLSTYNTAVADWQAAGDLVDSLAVLTGAAATAAGKVTTAEAAISDPISKGGLGLDIVTAADVNNVMTLAFDDGTSPADEVAVLTDKLAKVANFGDGSTDRLFIGTDYTVVTLGADADMSASVGNVAALEVFVSENTDVNGAVTGVSLYFETETFGGNGAGADNLQQVDIAGVTLADLTFLDNGILVGEIVA